MLEIDGAYGEGGGQLLRTAVALAAITRRTVRISNIRAGRARPGLAAQHIAAVRAVAALCEARVTNLVPRATEIEFDPGAIRGGTFRFEIGTAGSATLVLQALIPVAAAGSDPCRVVVQGGSDVRGAPPADYLRHVLLALLAPMDVDAVLEVRRRGYYPRGGGELELALAPAALRAQQWNRLGRVQRVCGHAHVSRLARDIAERMRDAALRTLGASGLSATIDVSVGGTDQAAGPGGAVVLWAQGEASVLGAARVAQRGIRAEALGDDAAAEIAADIAAGAALDAHAADQILVYLALARGESSFATRELTSHARTAMWLIERFLPVRFAVEPAGTLVRVRVLAS